MHIETLKVFCDVVETRSFSTAASQNFVTQSAVSQQIRALETKYDCKLIERTRGAVQVTPAGEVVYQASKEIVQRYLDMESGLQSLNNRVGGTLRIATVYSVGLYELSSPLRRFLKAYPQVKVDLDYRRPAEIQEDALRGAIDFGIVAYPAKRPHLVILPFREDRLVLICHPQHPLASYKQISIQKVAEVDNIDTIKRFVEVGQGVAIVPEPSVQAEVKSETLCAVHFSDERLSRPLAIVHRKGKQFSLAAERFIEFLMSKSADEVEAKTRAS